MSGCSSEKCPQGGSHGSSRAPTTLNTNDPPPPSQTLKRRAASQLLPVVLDHIGLSTQESLYCGSISTVTQGPCNSQHALSSRNSARHHLKSFLGKMTFRPCLDFMFFSEAISSFETSLQVGDIRNVKLFFHPEGTSCSSFALNSALS